MIIDNREIKFARKINKNIPVRTTDPSVIDKNKRANESNLHCE